MSLAEGETWNDWRHMYDERHASSSFLPLGSLQYLSFRGLNLPACRHAYAGFFRIRSLDSSALSDRLGGGPHGAKAPIDNLCMELFGRPDCTLTATHLRTARLHKVASCS
jgi:hypothetical protein